MIFTERGERRRIISAPRAGSNERRSYDDRRAAATGWDGGSGDA
ncbi:MAG: hypothetical protein AVDCRST_MAG59-4172 [uncultured Thermomicrobiales bacterium]|uniref:Uncharacterized protein n=1 Tax=uncultured Thermomicrobiales bacterium TaxID=1645740 RepID=A0A6J4VDD3_9BACT|nr:MAG: hypothetical protein AVDCRST_MAG59-4172 [uncultured Thermomicrobiales bacterium]